MPQQTGGVSSLDDLEYIIDADTHVQESYEMFAPYIDDAHEGAKRLMDYATWPYIEIYSVSLASPTYSYTKMRDDADGDDDHIAEPKAVEGTAEKMDELGIDRGIVNPTINLGLPTVNNPRFAVALANGYNNWLVQELDDHENLKGNMLVAPHAPDKAAEEIDRMAGEDDIVGIQFVATGIVPPPGHRMYYPIWEAAQRHDLPVSMHSGTGAKGFSQQFFWAETYAEDHVIEHPFSHMWNLTSMMFRGIPELFPDLTFVFQEAGIGYIPYVVQRLDDHYLELGYEIPALEKLPSKYIDDSFYFSTQPLGHADRNPKYTAWLIEMAGPENIMFSSDVPHPDFDTPSELFDRIKSHFDGETIRAIMGETARDVYGLQ